MKILGKMRLRDQNNGKKIEINGSRIYHVTTLSLYSIDGVFIRGIRISIPAKFSPFERVKRIAVRKEGRVAICHRKRIFLVQEY